MRTTNKWGLVVGAAAAACANAGYHGGDGTRDDANAAGETDASSVVDAMSAVELPPQTERLRIVSQCTDPIWIAHSNNLPGAQNIRLDHGQFHDYVIPASGLASARFWPKLGCDASGHNCHIGDSGEGGGAPCGPAGCQPPIDSKFEATFAATNTSAFTFYNLSLVDGYTLPFTVTPVGSGAGVGSCTASDCSALTLDDCPIAEDLGGTSFPAYADHDLRVRDPVNASRTIGCVSPCKAWNYPAPYGLGRSESEDPGLHLCCPTPIPPTSGNCTPANGCMTAAACRSTSDPLGVVHRDYVGLVHARCPTAYSYAYDDAAGLHACPADTGFAVVFCP
jgi:hypothetical protein